MSTERYRPSMVGDLHRSYRRGSGSRDGFVRPTAYFWVSFQRVCVIAFVPCLLASFVLIFGFHEFWMAYGLGVLAFASQTGNIGGLVQRTRELRLGYTTIPQLATEVALRDPIDGRFLTDRHQAHPQFGSMKLAREYSRQHPRQASTDAQVPPLVQQESVQQAGPDSPNKVPIVDQRGRGLLARFVAGITLLVLGLICAFVLLNLPAFSEFRAVGFTVGLVVSVAALSLVLVYLTGAANRRLASQLHALSNLPDEVTLFPVRRTVELFGELSTDRLAAIQPELVLSISQGELALWSGKRILRKLHSIPRARIETVSLSRAHDTRENEKPAILISSADSDQLLLFPRGVGRSVLSYADEAGTDSVVRQIRAALERR
jgi:hypothetical protein